jgi:hypothetical protein
MALTVRPGHLPHIKWIDLHNNGTLIEVAVMNEDSLGNISFVQVNQLDAVDRRRLLKIITGRQATTMKLWDLLSTITLNNGVNALTYFHQLVRTISQSGVISSPRPGELGTGMMIDVGVQKAKKKAAKKKAAVEAAEDAETDEDEE